MMSGDGREGALMCPGADSVSALLSDISAGETTTIDQIIGTKVLHQPSMLVKVPPARSCEATPAMAAIGIDFHPRSAFAICAMNGMAQRHNAAIAQKPPAPSRP
jgi:hypothetical protein